MKLIFFILGFLACSALVFFVTEFSDSETAAYSVSLFAAIRDHRSDLVAELKGDNFDDFVAKEHIKKLLTKDGGGPIDVQILGSRNSPVLVISFARASFLFCCDSEDKGSIYLLPRMTYWGGLASRRMIKLR